MRTKHIYFLLFILGISLSNACKKDDPPPANPISGFTVSKLTAVVDEEVQFTNTSANATSFKWSFGDGTTSTDASPKKSYQTSDNFTVTLVATGAGGSNTNTTVVKVLPFGGFTVENEADLIANKPVQMTNSSKGAVSYQWAFGDPANSTATTANPTFTYPAAGTYTVTLKAISAVGETAVSKTITVKGAPVTKDLYYIEYTANAIKKLALDGSGTTASVLDITGKAGAGMALDAVNNKIYFSDFEVTGTGNIWRMNLDGTGLTAIASNLSDPYGVAVDPAGGKVYWVDDLGNVSRANLDGSSPQIGLVNIPSGQMRAIALDLKNNKMYFYEVNAEILYVANLDGSNVTPLITASYGYAILVDTVNNKLYYDEQNAGKLFQTNLDGTGQVTIDADGTRIYGMAIDHTENKLYWSGRDNGKVIRANLDGSSPETLATGLTSPRGIALKL
jgi:PKD repeat protein